MPLSVAKAYEEEFSAAYPNILGWQVPVVPILGAAWLAMGFPTPRRARRWSLPQRLRVGDR